MATEMGLEFGASHRDTLQFFLRSLNVKTNCGFAQALTGDVLMQGSGGFLPSSLCLLEY